jgi:two-component sensor histidine kinase
LFISSADVQVFTYTLSCAQEPGQVDGLLADVSSAKSDTDKVHLLLVISVGYQPIDITKQFYYANEALSISERVNWDKGRMYAQQQIADCYNKVMAYNNAIAHFKRCISAAEKLNETNIQIACYRAIVLDYYTLNKTDDMVIYQKAALDLAERVGEPSSISAQMNSYALRLSDASRYGQAVAYWQQVIAFADTHFQGMEKNIHVANILNTLANTYVKTHKPDSALYCLRTASRMITASDDYSLKAYIRSTFCDVYESTNTYDSAEIYGEQTVRMGEELKNIELQQHYCQTLSRVYESDRKPQLALLYYKKSDSLANIISNNGRTVELAMQVTRINMEQQAERNKEENSSLEAIRKNQRVALIAAVVALLALITLTAFIYRTLRLKQKANKIISLQAASLKQQNEIIDKALKEKEVLLKETHHRVKNNLQLISSLLELQAESLEEESAKNALRTAQRRVLSIATVHSKLYGSDEDEAIDFSAFTADLFTRLHSAFDRADTSVQFNNSIPAAYLPLNTVVLLGLILNELITNSFKHAFTGMSKGIISISMETAASAYTLRYYDSGSGLPESVFNAGSGSLGLYLVKRLSKQLKGTATYKFGAGSTFTIIFPHAAG